MSDGTTLFFALPDFRVLDVSLEADGGRRVLVESVAGEGACPSCGVLSARVKDRPISRVKDLPYGPVPLRVSVRKRRFLCAEQLCPRRSFTEATAQLPRIFGNISEADIRKTVEAASGMLVRGGSVIWTRGYFTDSDLRPQIRYWFAQAGFTETAFDAELTGYGIGVNRLTSDATATSISGRLFSFVR